MNYWAKHAENCRCGCNSNNLLKLNENPKKLVTVLGGFLGAGKTTTLNHILSQDAERRIDVIVNEFGSVAIDDKLIGTDKSRIHPFTGASMHVDRQTMLTSFIEKLYAESVSKPFDQLVIEASGAESAESMLQIFYLPRSRSHYALGSYICVIDGQFGSLNLHEFQVARVQVAFADYLVINKCDCADEEELEQLVKELRIINPFAEIIKTSYGRIDAERLFAADHYTQLKSMTGDREGDESVEDFKSITLRLKEPLDRKKVDLWIKDLYARWGKKLLRGKGYFHIAGSEYRFDFQSVRTNFHAKTESLWESEEAKETLLVFIGTELPEKQELMASLSACKAKSQPVKIKFGKE